MLDINAALEYATRKHQGQKRLGGEDYIIHPYEVMQLVKEKGYDESYQVCALFHDLLEDTNATEEEILELSNSEVLNAVKLLTKTDNYVMSKYITDIFKNDMARVIKQADRLHNLRSAVGVSDEFKIKYINETKDYYYPLITGREFEKEIIEALNSLVNTIK